MTTVPVVRFVIAGMEPAAAPILGRNYTVVYDGNCTVCGKLVKLLRKWDRQEELEIVPSQAPGVRARFPWIPNRAFDEAVQLIGPGGRTWQGADAIEQLLDVLPRGGLIGWIFHIPFVRPLAHRIYRWFARNRFHLGCGKHCAYRPPNVDFHEPA